MEQNLLSHYFYDLPQERIAIYPLAERDHAKLLVFNKAKEIIHSDFRQIGNFLPENSLMVLNNTRVIRARLLFQRDSGARVEVFCLEPVFPFKEMNQAMQVTGETTWNCLAGNQKRWKTGEKLTMSLGGPDILTATLIEKTGKEVLVKFNWEPNSHSWAAILERAGKMPLPPYLNREAEIIDENDYQTVFAQHDGAVAAPTASLHFTTKLLEKLVAKGTILENITLHVGAGTFQAVNHENILEHPMHREQIIFEKPLIEKLKTGKHKIMAAGTTSLRALESLFWFGNQLEINPDTENFFIEKLSPYQKKDSITLSKSMQNILEWMERQKLQTLAGETEIFIFPGYEFKVCDGLITNFHQPHSTLLMLIGAFIGNDWKNIYQTAMEKDYRFLSYGDGMLLLR